MDPTILVRERLGYTQTRRNKLMIAMNKNMAKPMHIPEVTYETSAVAMYIASGLWWFCIQHVLLLLSHKGLEEIPSQYILQRYLAQDVKF